MANAKLPKRAVGVTFTEAEARVINETFSGLSPDAPLFQALGLLLAGYEAGEVATALNPQWTAEQRQFWAGNAYAVGEIRELVALARRGELGAQRK